MFIDGVNHYEKLFCLVNTGYSGTTSKINKQNSIQESTRNLAEILFITSYPPRECGIATYSQDLIKSINNKFSNSLSIKVCALESSDTNYPYPAEVEYILKTSIADEYEKLALIINKNKRIKIIVIQHEFGLYSEQEQAFQQFLSVLSIPVITVFHTVLPQPDEKLRTKVRSIIDVCESIIVMTNTSANILTNEYDVPQQKISVIAHGTHLVPRLNKTSLKLK